MIQDFTQHTTRVHNIISELIEVDYSLLREEISKVQELLSVEEITDLRLALKPTIVSLNTTLDGMIGKEKFVLFPNLEQLADENRSLENTRPIELIKKECGLIMQQFAQGKLLLDEYATNDIIQSFVDPILNKWKATERLFSEVILPKKEELFNLFLGVRK